jgi:KUP system potassium uptake protein
MGMFPIVSCRMVRLIGLGRFAVATVMIVTTSLLAIQIPYVKRLPAVLGFAFFIFFGFIDGKTITMFRIGYMLTTFKRIGLFWGASLTKVPHGAWVPLMIGSAL